MAYCQEPDFFAYASNNGVSKQLTLVMMLFVVNKQKNTSNIHFDVFLYDLLIIKKQVIKTLNLTI